MDNVNNIEYNKVIYRRQDPNILLAELIGGQYREYRDIWNKTSKGEIEVDYPIQLDIELNNMCNLKCPMCLKGGMIESKEYGYQTIPMDAYRNIIDEAVIMGVKSIQLNYLNEPLTLMGICEYIKYAAKKGILDIMISTNGMLLEKYISLNLCNSGLTKLSVSIDAFSSNTYDKIRIGGNYKQVIGNCLNYLNIRKILNRKIPLLKVTFIKNALNEHEECDFILYWIERADMILIKTIMNPFIDKEMTDRMNEYFRIGNYYGKCIRRCPHPFQRMTIRTDGTALLCCNQRGVNLLLGNIIEKGIRNVYYSDKAKYYRKLHREGNYVMIPTCNECIKTNVPIKERIF